MRRVWSGEHESVLPHKLDKLFLELASERDNRVKVVGPDNHYTFIALYSREKNQGEESFGDTYDECTTLFFIRTGQHAHRINDLNLGILINND